MSRKAPNPHGDKRRARRRALQALYQWHLTDQAPADIYQQFVDEQDMARVDVAYFRELLHEVVANREQIDQRIGEVADRELDRIDPLELSVIRLGAYELLYRLETPYRVVLDEAVALARDFGSDQAPIYVNGVLDRGARDWRTAEVGAASGS